MTQSEHDPFATPPAPQGQRRSSVVTLVIVGASVLVVGVMGLSAWLLVSNVRDDDGSWFRGFDEDSPVNSGIISNSRPDLTSFTAVPGDRYVYEGFEQLQVGQDVPAGVYMAEVHDGDYAQCEWTVQSDSTLTVDSFYADGWGTQHGAAAVLPEGYFVYFMGCDTWVVVDPATLFEGEPRDVLGDGTHYVGRDLAPGTYVLSRSDSENHPHCFVAVSEQWGFTGPHMRHAFLEPDDHPAVLELEEGYTVTSSGCPPLPLVAAEQVLSPEAGSSELTDGGWVVGVDAQAGTYMTSDEVEAAHTSCGISAWEAGALQSVVWDEVGVPSHYGKKAFETRLPDEPPLEVTVDVGDTIRVLGCGTVSRVGD